MSSRVLKKLHGDNDLEIRDQDGSDIENESSFGARKKQFDGNRYDLVNDYYFPIPVILSAAISILAKFFSWFCCCFPCILFSFYSVHIYKFYITRYAHADVSYVFVLCFSCTQKYDKLMCESVTVNKSNK